MRVDLQDPRRTITPLQTVRTVSQVHCPLLILSRSLSFSHTHTHTHTHTQTHTPLYYTTNTDTHTCMHLHTHVLQHTHRHTHKHTDTHTHTCTHTHNVVCSGQQADCIRHSAGLQIKFSEACLNTRKPFKLSSSV